MDVTIIIHTVTDAILYSTLNHIFRDVLKDDRYRCKDRRVVVERKLKSNETPSRSASILLYCRLTATTERVNLNRPDKTDYHRYLQKIAS